VARLMRRCAPLRGRRGGKVGRPFVVIDPRAGHGPGIGGFKAQSEIGMAMEAGHPAYFIGFLPEPVPGQTIEDIAEAEAAPLPFGSLMPNLMISRKDCGE
jgi:hypothetical protein